MPSNRRKRRSDDSDPAIDCGLTPDQFEKTIEEYNATGDTAKLDLVFGSLFGPHYTKILRIVAARLRASLNSDQVEIAVDDAIARLLKRLLTRTFTSVNVVGWVIDAATKCDQEARRKTKHINDENDFDDLDSSASLVTSDDPDDDNGDGGAALTPDQEQRLVVITSVLSTLDPKKKGIMLRLPDMMNGSVNAREIAAEFGVSHDMVRQVACRTRKKIEQLCKGGGFE